MKYQKHSLPLFASVLATLAASSLLNCSSDTSTNAKTAEQGAAGETSGEAGAPPVTICGNRAALSACDPLTGAGCDIAGGETCDGDPTGVFACYPGPNTAGPGDACGQAAGAFCSASTTCNGELHQCEHYCCADSDCEHGKCNPNQFTDGDASIGVCTNEFVSPGAGGEGGAAGAPVAGAGGTGG